MIDLTDSNSAVLAASFGLTAGLAWGVADFYGAKAAKAYHPTQAAGAVELWGSLVFVLVYVVALRSSWTIDAAGTACALGAGAIFALGLVTFFHGLEAGPVSIVTPLGSAYPLVTTLLAIALFAARPSAVQLAGIALIVAGVVACSGIGETRRSEVRLTRGVVFGAATCALWGIGFTALDKGVDHLGWATSTLMQNLGSAATFAVVLPLLRRRGAPPGFGRLFVTPPIVLAGLIVLLGDVSFNVGLSTSADAGATIVIAISACYPALTILLALRHFGEEVRAVPLGGAVAAILGVVALTAT